MILLSVAAGTYILGLVGALFAVPVIATVKSMVSYLHGVDPFPKLDDGGSALTDSPRRLVDGVGDLRIPKRVGDATLKWLQGEIDRQDQERETASDNGRR